MSQFETYILYSSMRDETNIKVIQSIMGHVDIKTTMNIYAEVSEKKKQESLNQISEKLNLF